MPKKIDKKKKVIKKKVSKKKPKSNVKEKKPPTVKPPTIVIHTQRLPKTKCCTEVNKTGEGYTIPFGYKDLKGTEPITPAVSKATTKKTMEIETQTENGTTIAYVKSGSDEPLDEPIKIIKPLVKTRRTKQEMSEAKQMEREDAASINLGLSKYENKPTTAIEIKSEIEPVIAKKLRKNSMEDLQQRYYDQTGEFFNITKGFKIKDFKELVEKMERL